MQLSVAVSGVTPDSMVKPRLDRILQIMNQGIEEGRNTIRGLRSSDSHTLDLVLALSRVQQELSAQHDIDFRVIVAGRQQPLQSPIGHEIYRLAERPWSMRFGIPGRSASSSNLTMPKTTCVCAFATTDVELILKFSKQDVRDTGVWQACGSGRRESAGCLTFPVVQMPGRRSDCQSQAVLLSNYAVLETRKSV